MSSARKKRTRAIDDAVADFRLAYDEIGYAAMEAMLAGPCGYEPGSAYKVAVKHWRHKFGLPIDVAGDRNALVDIVSRGHHNERQSLPLPQGGMKR